MTLCSFTLFKRTIYATPASGSYAPPTLSRTETIYKPITSNKRDNPVIR